jgi:type I restriction enzyme M protein
MSSGTETTTLGKLVWIFTGIVPSRLKGGPEAPRYPVLNTKDVSFALPEPAELEQLALDDPTVQDRFGLKAGDIVLTARGSRVRAGVAREVHVGLIAGANLIVARPSAVIDPVVLATWLQHPKVQDRLLQSRSGVGTPGFTTRQLAALEIVVPSAGEQSELRTITELAARQYEAAVRSASLRKTLANDLVFDTLGSGIVGGRQ